MQAQVPIKKCFHRPNMIDFVKGFHKVNSESFMRTAPMSSKLEKAKLNLTFQGELIFSGKSAHVRWPRAKSAREVTGRERAQKLRLYMSPNLFSQYFLKIPPQKFFEFFPCGTMKAPVTKCWPLVSKARRTCDKQLCFLTSSTWFPDNRCYGSLHFGFSERKSSDPLPSTSNLARTCHKRSCLSTSLS